MNPYQSGDTCDNGDPCQLRDNLHEFSNLRKISFFTSPDPFDWEESGQIEICQIDPEAQAEGEEDLYNLAEELRQQIHCSDFPWGP